MAQWIELLTTDQRVGGSSPFEIVFFQKEEYLWNPVTKMFFIKAVNNANNNFIKKNEKVLLIKELNKLYNKNIGILLY